MNVPSFDLTNDLNQVNTEIGTLKNSVSDGKSKVANAITEKGIPTATDATFDTLANNIGQISSTPTYQIDTFTTDVYGNLAQYATKTYTFSLPDYDFAWVSGRSDPYYRMGIFGSSFNRTSKVLSVTIGTSKGDSYGGTITYQGLKIVT